MEAGGTPVPELSTAAVFVDAWPDRSIVGPPLRYGADRPAPGLPATAVHWLLTDTRLPHLQAPPAGDRPFLTIITRTQGTRLLMLEEMLTCLCAQSLRDFELLVACHRVSESDGRRIRKVVADLPTWLREQIRVIDVDRPGRAAPLNDALSFATGRYFAVLDDDDAVTADWVATFADMEPGHEGTVLRTSALRQDVEPVAASQGGGVTPKEVGPAYPGWPRTFSLVEHLWDNASPFMTLAFPRGLFVDLKWRFDESMETAEDWAYLLRSAGLVGVTDSSRLTAVYRTWTRQEGSREIHDPAAWDASRRAAIAAVNDAPLVLAPGAVQDIRALHEALLEERAEKFRFAGLNEQAAADLRTVNEAVVALRERVAQLEDRLARVKSRRSSG
ncbi:glycosyltransferase family 2 protein [Nocardioides sp.]|uniref:glycosyltransferase family A protein n=1 Tax=Nocardioides sp. TaxID=35761 RepID=UPI00260C151C|nr:glycosyltransferase family 2 protein [Nocardioides sp.]MCW2738736.1 hypothetical protein [Nocardioides sp.]